MSDEVKKPAPVGAPRQMEGGRRVNVYLDEISIAEAQRLGAGEISAGIRIALKLSKLRVDLAAAKTKKQGK